MRPKPSANRPGPTSSRPRPRYPSVTSSHRLNVNGWQGKGAIYNNLYKYNFVEGGVDLLFDLCNLFGQDRIDRTLNPYAVLGGGVNYAFNNDEANAYKTQFATLPNNLLWEDKSISPAGKAGLGLNIRLSNAVDLNLEGNTSFINNKFNSKPSADSPVDFQIAALAGLVFHFGRGSAPEPEPVPVLVPVETPAPAPKPQPKPEPKVEPEPVVVPSSEPAFAPVPSCEVVSAPACSAASGLDRL